ncbi:MULTISPECIES: GNAT family N-acetyltransferase [unclassified Streptomyces]|uniref:GNAT family N-acetyltransferase n=1 Tax=unclassified Streptomyces TaxID=2593676 RepID=UPI00324B7CB1
MGSEQAVPARTSSTPAANWTLRSAVAEDVEVIAELRAAVMRADLERLGRYDEHRVRQRLRDSFSPQHTSIIEIGGELAGCVTVRPAEGRQWLEHFYLATHCQGRGLGSAVLRTVLERTDVQGVTVGLNVLQGSAARRLYERHGFAVEAQDPIDVFMVRAPGTTAGPGPLRAPGTSRAAPPAHAVDARKRPAPCPGS